MINKVCMNIEKRYNYFKSQARTKTISSAMIATVALGTAGVAANNISKIQNAKKENPAHVITADDKTKNSTALLQSIAAITLGAASALASKRAANAKKEAEGVKDFRNGLIDTIFDERTFIEERANCLRKNMEENLTEIKRLEKEKDEISDKIFENKLNIKLYDDANEIDKIMHTDECICKANIKDLTSEKELIEKQISKMKAAREKDINTLSRMQEKLIIMENQIRTLEMINLK